MSGRAPGGTSPGSDADHDPSSGTPEAAAPSAATWYYGADLDDLDEEGDDPDYVYEVDEDDEVLDFFDAEEGDEVDDDDDAADEEEEEDDDEDEGLLGNVGFQVVIGGEGGDGGEEHIEGSVPILSLLRAARSGQWSSRQLLNVLRNQEMGEILGQAITDGEVDEDDDDGIPWGRFLRRRRRAPKDPNRFPKVPSDEGTDLMRSGRFGANHVDYDRRVRKNVARRLLERELGLGSRDDRRRNNDLLTQDLLPTTEAKHIIHYDDPVYSGQFSDDGNFFFSCCQDFNVRMYDTSNPYNWKHYKTASYPWGQWTLTDASLSPDNKWLAYTSISSLVSIAPTDPLDTGDPYTLDLSDSPEMRRGAWGRAGSFSGIWSVRFSGDGRELVAGTNRDSLVVYDIESRRVLHHIDGHENDVNAVCFADKQSPHIIYSGSDDATIKVWDRRSMGDRREAGAFVGHIEGLTYIDSKGDGRYILSNGKDQSMKLWDLRMIMSTGQFRELDPTKHTRYSDFDYRTGRYNENDWDVHPNDNSLVTFRGHKVLNTLIRCHFSPPSATNSRYVYTGSRDGKVYVYNMDATIAKVIDVREATLGSRPLDGHERRFYRFEHMGHWSTCVRDASWHPNAPFIVASAWNGYNLSRGTCTLHSFDVMEEDVLEPKMTRNLDDKLRPAPWSDMEDDGNL